MNLNKQLLSVATTLLLAVPALADGWEGSSEYNQHYSRKNVQTISGTILHIDRRHVPIKGMASGLAITVQPAEGPSQEVEVGPDWFTNFYRPYWDFQVGDQVTMTGSLVDLNGHKTMLASQGLKGDHKLTVRNTHGQPVWDLKFAGF